MLHLKKTSIIWLLLLGMLELNSVALSVELSPKSPIKASDRPSNCQDENSNYPCPKQHPSSDRN